MSRRTLIMIAGAGLILVCGGALCVAGIGVLGWGIFDFQTDATPPEEVSGPSQSGQPTPLEPDQVPTSPPDPTPGGAPVNPSWSTYQDPDGFYTLQYPPAWTPQTAGSQQQFCADPDANVCVAVRRHIKALNPQTLLEQTTINLQESLGSYQESPVEQIFLGGLPGVRADHSYVWRGMAQRGFMAFALRNRVGYEAMAWAPIDSYGQHEGALQQVVDSLQILSQPEAPLYEDWQFYQSEHLTFYYPQDAWLGGYIQAIADDHEWALANIEHALNVTHNGVITFYLYPSEEALFQSTARRSGFAINEGGEVHSLWRSADDHQSLGHEMTHVISYWTIGEPFEALLGEGLAVCLDQSGRDYRQVGRQILSDGDWIPMENLLGETWFDQPAEIAYPQSGAFVCYLLAKYELDNFKVLYIYPVIGSGLEQFYELSPSAAETDWIAWLQGN